MRWCCPAAPRGRFQASARGRWYLWSVMQEVLPGVWHWTAEHPKIGIEVSSHWVPAAGALIDPLLPPAEGMDAFREQPPDLILLSNRHHLRHAERFAEEFGCTIECSKLG